MIYRRIYNSSVHIVFPKYSSFSQLPGIGDGDFGFGYTAFSGSDLLFVISLEGNSSKRLLVFFIEILLDLVGVEVLLILALQ